MLRDRLLRAINLTKASIDLAIFDFTSGELAGALLAARERGVAIRVVADARQAQGKHSEIPLLLERGVKVRLARGNARGIMHHKFAIFDGKLLVTGSYNWTDSAERFNHENAIILDDPVVIGRYQVSFERLYNGPGAVSRIPSSYGSASFGPIIPETPDRQGHSWVQVFGGTSDRPCHTSVTSSTGGGGRDDLRSWGGRDPTGSE